jgi:hypothetical protein
MNTHATQLQPDRITRGVKAAAHSKISNGVSWVEDAEAAAAHAAAGAGASASANPSFLISEHHFCFDHGGKNLDFGLSAAGASGVLTTGIFFSSGVPV